MEIIKMKSDIKLMKSTAGSAGYDIPSAEDTVLKSGEYKAVSTEIYMEIPKGFEAQVRPRSGLAAKHGVTVLNSPGTIDSDYRGEIKVILINHSKEDFEIKKGMRIAQLVFSKIIDVKFLFCENLTETERNVGSFGSTGI